VDGERFSIEAAWTRCRSSARPSRCGTANGTCTSARRRRPDTLAEIKYDHDRLGDVTGQRVTAGRKQYRLVVTGTTTR
jgi:hypothetical protein